MQPTTQVVGEGRYTPPAPKGRKKNCHHRDTVYIMTAVSDTTRPSEDSTSQLREITVAHSPDSDDAFMFYGLATHKVRTPGLRFTHTLCDIQTLNQKAQE